MIQHLYVHVPFCTHICPYCSFYVTRNLMPVMKTFLPALESEVLWAEQEFQLQPRTCYFGGGTPSALSVSQLAELKRFWKWHSVEEFTMECNPATLSQDKIRCLRELGVNRVSLGVQSMDTQFLKLLGRVHTPEQVTETVQRLRLGGMSNISIDLMFGLPGQTLEQWRETLEKVLRLNPEHISAYNLTYEEDTEFLQRLTQGEWTLDETLHAEMFLMTRDLLREHGFEGYEISNFAKSGFQSVHNHAYWDGVDFLGLGPSSTSTVGNMRWKNIPDAMRYAESLAAEGKPLRELEPLTQEVMNTERIMLRLRTSKGLELEFLTPPAQLRVQDLISEELGWIDTNMLKLTPAGLLKVDQIAEILTS